MPTKATGRTEELINAFYDNYSSSIPEESWYRANVDQNYEHSILGGGRHYLEGFKTNASYEWQQATSYSKADITFKRRKISGIWGAWI